MLILFAVFDIYFLKTASTEIKSVWQIVKPYIKTEINNISDDKQVEMSVVIKIIDGDTIELVNGEKVRYIGIDTPELYKTDKNKKVECFSKEATKANSDLVLNKQIRLIKDKSNRDKYGRLLRYVYVDDVLVNEYLVKNGFAYAKEYYPDIAKQDIFKFAQEQAREQKLGLWEKCFK